MLHYEPVRGFNCVSSVSDGNSDILLLPLLSQEAESVQLKNPAALHSDTEQLYDLLHRFSSLTLCLAQQFPCRQVCCIESVAQVRSLKQHQHDDLSSSDVLCSH